MSKYVARPKDVYGTRKGTVSARINKAMSEQWQTLEVIRTKTGLSDVSVRQSIAYGLRKGIYEQERKIRFKLKKRKLKQ